MYYALILSLYILRVSTVRTSGLMISISFRPPSMVILKFQQSILKPSKYPEFRVLISGLLKSRLTTNLSACSPFQMSSSP